MIKNYNRHPHGPRYSLETRVRAQRIHDVVPDKFVLSPARLSSI
jgi:hypothetical protein